jgi:hypothetical protein
MDEIARRLDELVRAVSEVPELDRPPAIKDGILDAAKRAWKARRERQRLFGPSIAADPAWDILLDLFIARIEGREVTISTAAATIGSSEPTLLRWVAQLIENKFVSSPSYGAEPLNRRLSLTDEGLNLMCDYFIRTSPDLDVAAV